MNTHTQEKLCFIPILLEIAAVAVVAIESAESTASLLSTTWRGERRRN